MCSYVLALLVSVTRAVLVGPLIVGLQHSQDALDLLHVAVAVRGALGLKENVTVAQVKCSQLKWGARIKSKAQLFRVNAIVW